MIPSLRQQFNAGFQVDNYQHMVDHFAKNFDHAPPFRIAETPVFIPSSFRDQLKEACRYINDVICSPDFKEKSKGALLQDNMVPNEDEHTFFLQMDFGVCKDENGHLSPQLIEIQGFPSLYFFQNELAKAYRKFTDIPEGMTHLFSGLNADTYLELLRRTIVRDTDPEQIILLEVEPEKQATYIDFRIAEKLLGISVVCVSKLIVDENRNVFYKNKEGKTIQVKKIINRVIFDELLKRDDLPRQFRFTEPANIEWVGHPNWFFRISKHTLPLLNNPYVPKSYFLNELDTIPKDLENYVLKPLYSFAGSGVLINLNRYDFDAIKDPENYILQRKVNYAPVIETPSGPAKCEVRVMFIWEKGVARPKVVNNLVRLSKGEMVGVRYNKGKDWVGGSVGFFYD